MTDIEQKNIVEKLNDLWDKLAASSATQEEKDAMIIVLNQVRTDMQKIDANPTSCA